ncbi:MAG: enoyl-CoA hydratase/isomerase family protein, partial [Chloroflexota bacterium]|nr:enoyl-CoA hydratase/isomerase family protein [Chloroflexota bacterium]
MLDETKLQWIELHRVNHVAVMTLKRPDQLNALTREMTRELHSALDQVSEEFPNIRVLILTGAGRGFCSGADVSDISRRLDGGTVTIPSEQSRGPSEIMRLAPHLKEIPQPVIAAVNGVAAGAGLGLALSCDIRVGSESARFTSVFVKRSLVPDAGVSQLLGTLVGPGVAS